MRTCFVVPGILGSQLGTPEIPGLIDDVLWVQTTRLALGQFPQLSLAANGIDPNPGTGERCVPRGILPHYYDALIRALERSLSEGEWTVKTFGYDWRKFTFTNGELLAQAVMDAATPEQPAAIVAHSLGGLVARAAWAVLSAAGQGQLVKRIVTLGTPHRGAYAPCDVWALEDDLVSQLPSLVNGISGFAQLVGPTIPQTYTTPRATSQVSATWPAMYELMPLVDSLSEIADPLRAALFNPENWPAISQLSALHLERAATLWRSFLLSPVTMPPDQVLTCVGGTGFRTSFYLRNIDNLTSGESYGQTEFGDGKVAIDSAIRVPGYSFIVGSNHSALPVCNAVTERIGQWVTEERGSGPPPELPGEFLSGSAGSLAGPPYPGTPSGFPDW